MKKVEIIRSRVNPLPVDDVDTDQIIPARFLKTTGRVGLGASLFADWRGSRFDASSDARILLAGNNFGCGSSREHAVWALTDFGFQAVIAPSFADIFKANALKNGLVPVAVEGAVYNYLSSARAADADVSVRIDVRKTVIVLPDNEEVPFPLDPFARRCLVDGIDELEYLRQHDAQIGEWEARHARG
jgi:3-isopropylmalate/(R)-2-methylmalate dehydratase small subunit